MEVWITPLIPVESASDQKSAYVEFVNIHTYIYIYIIVNVCLCVGGCYH